MRNRIARLVTAALLSSACCIAAAASSYQLAASIDLGAPDRWDYVYYDNSSGRVFVAHGDRISVVDPATRQVVGELHGLAAAHGTTFDPESKLIFADDSGDGSTSAFDAATLEVKFKLASGKDSDGVLFEPVTGTVLVIDGDQGDITAIDGQHTRPSQTIKVGGGLEAAVADGQGDVFVNGAERQEISRVDVRKHAVTARWSIQGCERPHGIAYDPASRHIFVSCVNQLLFVVDSSDGQVLARLPIGKGTDAAAFDPLRKRVFSSNGKDGTLTVIQQSQDGSYQVIDTVSTAVSGRTMDIDPATGALFIAAAKVDSSAAPVNGRPKLIAGSLQLLIYEPTR
jgi:DNA-binding beta-propeller fold protein YncE